MNLDDAGLTHEYEQQAGLRVQIMDAIGQDDADNVVFHSAITS
jgi:hypothetical protein